MGQDISGKCRRSKSIVLGHGCQILRYVSWRVWLARSSVSREPSPGTKQPDDTVRRFLNEWAGGLKDDLVRRCMRYAERFEASPPRREDDIHELEERKILNSTKVILLGLG